MALELDQETPLAEGADGEASSDNVSATPARKSGGKRTKAGIVLLVIIIVGAGFGLHWFIWSKGHVETDDAFIEAHIHSVSPRVSGTVTTVLVNDNQLVKKGDLLVTLDPTDYDAKVREATASLDMAKNETSGDYAKIEAARAAENNAAARLEQADIDLRRGNALFAKEVIPKEQLDRLVTTRRVAAAQLRESLEEVRKARAELGLSGSGSKEARVAQRAAVLKQATLNLSYTRIYAPADGYVTRKSVEPGNTVQTGQPLLAIVDLNDSWVVANYKESQLTNVKPGQQVQFKVDTYPNHTFSGRVDSVMAGTGAAFSLLPPENATGNYVKVVQRIPVKILIDKATDPSHLLRVGMSVVPTIDTNRRLGDILRDLWPF